MANRGMIQNNLIKNSIAAYFTAIEIHNKPKFSYRYETTTLLLMNAWELVLKAFVKKYIKNKNIFTKDGHTISIDKAIDYTEEYINTLEPKSFSTVKENLLLIESYRNNIVHYYNEQLEPYIFMLTAKSALNYVDFVKKYFLKDILAEEGLFILPLGFKLPFKPEDFLSKKATNYVSSPESREFIHSMLKIIGDLETQGVEDTIVVDFDIYLENVKRMKNSDLLIAITAKDEVNANTSNIYSGGIGGTYGYEKTYTLLMGRYPEENEENKIAIDISMMDLYEENEDEKIIFNKEFYLQICNIFEVEVCGVNDSNLEQGIYINNKLQEKINNPAPSVVYRYAKNQEIGREFDKYDINDKYDCFTMYRHLIGSVSDKTHTMREILVIIAFLLVFISFFTISSFVNMSIR